MFKKEKNNNNKISIQKENKRKIIEYLINSFLLNPDYKHSKEEIYLKLKIKNSLFIEKYFNYLKTQKYIKFTKNNFYITYNGYEYLEQEEEKIKSHENNLVSMTVSMVALLISAIVSLIGNVVLKAAIMIYMFFKMNKFTKDILNKKHY